MNPSGPNDPWQKFHTGPPELHKKKRLAPAVLKLMLLILLAGTAVWGGVRLLPAIGDLSVKLVTLFRQRPPVTTAPLPEETPPPEKPSAREMLNVLSPLLLKAPEKTVFTTDVEGRSLTIETGLAPYLQEFFQNELDHLKTLTRARPTLIAMVAMKPETGQILAMAGFDQETTGLRPAVSTVYPAASIFKIITASAALEETGLKPDSPLYFNGGKYTLYKRQLSDKKNRYTTTASLEDAFAQSINPVFGKLGAHALGGELLDTYARRFGFHEALGSDFPSISGHLTVTDRPYQWAEVGCGFNNTTTITPLFGAVITATLLNQGKVPHPYLIKNITNNQGISLYRHTSPEARTAVSAATAQSVIQMMGRTVSRGTARKAFRRYRKDKVLSRLAMGGKTGSLFNKEHTVKLDWFTGFAMEKESKERVVVSILVGHGEYIGTRAGAFACKIFKEYFLHLFTFSPKFNTNNT